MPFDRLRRREFITLLGGAAAAWPLVARAQQPAVPVIGFLSTGAPGPFEGMIAAFNRTLTDLGYVAGKTVIVEYRWAEGEYNRLPALAADLVNRRASVIATAGGAPTALAAKNATSTIPIVFIMGDDPVRAGLVASLNRPGGNVTGVSLFLAELLAKRLDLLAELVPPPASIALLVNPANPNAESDKSNGQAAARARGRHFLVVSASSVAEIDAAFVTLAQERVGALLIGTDILFTNQRDQFVALAASHKIPTLHQWRDFVISGGLVSYGTSHTEPYRQAASYAARILKGEKPGDLPVTQPTKFELVINLKTAKGLGLDVPDKLLALADEVIE
jgi:putative ABC transport system substrate-binding protein